MMFRSMTFLCSALLGSGEAEVNIVPEFSYLGRCSRLYRRAGQFNQTLPRHLVFVVFPAWCKALHGDLPTCLFVQDYIAVKEKYAKYLPHSAGRYAAKRFRKAQCPIVERLTNSMMMHGRNNGKKLMTVRIVKHAFEIIHLLTGENPLQVLVNAIINSGPREDSTRIGRAGTVRRQAVDVSPLRRVNQAIWLLCTGAREAAFRNIKTIAECLADELINAAKGSSNSYAIKKKDELERVAKSNR
uniref:Small ribosomal subunit protein uS7 n=2 Tax=Canis lupus familiaris TaxID=9615 RepID=A0A8P0PIA3_CANLF